MATEESLSRLDSQVSTDASPPEINSVAQESGQTSVACGKDVHAEIDTEESNFGPLVNESSSSFWNDSCSSFECGTWHMEIEKYKNLMPSDISIDYFDVLVLYSEDNKSAARKFCDHLKKDIKLKHNESVKAVLYDEFVPQAGPKLKLLQTALERCTYVFCYITKEFCEDKWIELSKDECLMEAIENEKKQWCVVPVITMPRRTANFQIPFGLRSLVSIHYYQNDQYYRDHVSALIQNNLHHRLDKERKQKQQQFTWFMRCPENKEKLRTKQQEKEKITEEAVNEGLICSQPLSLQKAGVQTGTDPHQQPGGTSFERRISDKLDCRGQCGESTRLIEENYPTCSNSIKSTNQLSHGGSTNHMEPVSLEFLTSGNMSYMPQLDGPNSTVASSSINSCTEEKMPIQEEGCTGATSDIQTDSDHTEPLSRGACREGTDTDNGYHSDQSVEPVSTKNDPSDNIFIESADQLYQGGSTNHMQPVVHKFAGNGNQSDMPLLDGQDSAVQSYSSINSYTGEKRHIQEESSIGAKFAEYLQDIGCLSLNPDVDGMHSKSDDQSQDTQMTPVNQSPGCWYQVSMKPAAPLLTRASSVTPFAAKITLMQGDSTSAKHIESDELDEDTFPDGGPLKSEGFVPNTPGDKEEWYYLDIDSFDARDPSVLDPINPRRRRKVSSSSTDNKSCTVS